MLEVEGAVVRFGDRCVLDDVDIALGPAETLAVLGPSGSGKTTLLRAVGGLHRLDGGRICWDGVDLAGVAAHERHFGLMFQEYALFPHRDVAGNVEFDAIRRRVETLFGGWPKGDISQIVRGGRGARIEHIPDDSTQTQIGIAFASVPFRLATRAPSRAELATRAWAFITMPKSIMPRIIRISTGATSANSRAAAPRWRVPGRCPRIRTPR